MVWYYRGSLRDYRGSGSRTKVVLNSIANENVSNPFQEEFIINRFY